MARLFSYLYRMETLDIYPSGRNLIGTFTGSLVFLAGGLWMLSLPQSELSFKHAAAGWLGTLFGGGAALAIGIRIVLHYTHRRPMLRLDRKGITFFDVRGQQTTVEWRQIEGFGECKIAQQRFITVLLQDAETAAEAEKSLRRKLAEFSIRCCGTPYSILPSTLDYPKKQLLPTLETYLHKYR